MELRPVVLIEDDPADVELTVAMVAAAGLANPLIVLRDGAEALDFLQGCLEGRPGHQPAIVLLDVRLPKVTGFELLAIAHDEGHLRSLPIVMVTGSTQEQELLRWYETAARAYVSKPLTVEALRGPAALAGARCRIGDGTLFIERVSAEAIGA